MGNTITVWFAVNKNGYLGMWLDEPTRNEETGKWEGKQPFINSVIYEGIKKLVEKSKMNWQSDAEALTIQINK